MSTVLIQSTSIQVPHGYYGQLKSKFWVHGTQGTEARGGAAKAFSGTGSML